MGFFGGSQPARKPSRAAIRTRPKPPEPRPGSGSGGDPLSAEFSRAMAELQLKTSAHVSAWHMDEAEWSVDQGIGSIVFTIPRRRITATAPVQIIGTYDTSDSTWLWGWSNPSLSAGLVSDARKMKEYGQAHGYQMLTSPKGTCPEAMAWNLVALACLRCGRQGAYRGPAGTTMVFMTFGDVAISKSP